MDNFHIIDHSTAECAVLDILYGYSKLLLSLIIIFFGLLTNNNSLALQALLVSRPSKTNDSEILKIYLNAQ